MIGPTNRQCIMPAVVVIPKDFLDVIISTEAPQTALTSGELIGHWNESGRNYFHYQTDQKSSTSTLSFLPIKKFSGQF
ncbi:MAG: hypothetical protein IPL23_08530 [Saprospiraceae bacterium]|nr:hypothetical protein [Saprospiraceae bacterium]